MEARIQRHRLDRADQEWLVIEEPLELGDVLVEADADQHLLVDCLTLWVTNCLGDEDRWMQRRTAFLHALTACRAAVVLVSNEVGLGIVPLGAETRRFVDEVGRLHQDLASICHTVTFVAAGLPMTLKASATGSADA